MRHRVYCRIPPNKREKFYYIQEKPHISNSVKTHIALLKKNCHNSKNKIILEMTARIGNMMWQKPEGGILLGSQNSKYLYNETVWQCNFSNDSPENLEL